MDRQDIWVVVIMRALILAAGRGSRLKKYTKDKPKCLVEVGKKPILQRQLESLKEANIKYVIIVVGYMAGYVINFCCELNEKLSSYFTFTFVHNSQYSTTNSAYSFFLAKDFIKDEPYIHLNCDVLFPGRLIKALCDYDYPNKIVIDTRAIPKDNMEQVIMVGHQITHMQNTLLKYCDGKAIGIAKLGPELMDWVIKRIERDLDHRRFQENFYGILRKAIKAKFDIFGYKSDSVYEINTVEDLEKWKDFPTD